MWPCCCVITIDSHFTSTLTDLLTGLFGISGPRSSSATHVKSTPSSCLLRMCFRKKDSLTAVLFMLLLFVSFFTTLLPLYHLTVRFCTGATLWMSHCSWYSCPSSPAWGPLMRNTSMYSGFSVGGKGGRRQLVMSMLNHINTGNSILSLSKCFKMV